MYHQAMHEWKLVTEDIEKNNFIKITKLDHFLSEKRVRVIRFSVISTVGTVN